MTESVGCGLLHSTECSWVRLSSLMLYYMPWAKPQNLDAVCPLTYFQLEAEQLRAQTFLPSHSLSLPPSSTLSLSLALFSLSLIAF